MAELGVNVDHVATVREARKTYEPDPVWAAAAAELGGADAITIHLREDRRHIQERDLRLLQETTSVRLNLEMACEPQVLAIALDARPAQVTLVPEKREEVTTEGGLDVAGNADHVAKYVTQLKEAGIFVSLFIDPDEPQVEASAQMGADAVELHTGQYALADDHGVAAELGRLHQASLAINQTSMRLHAGHGLNYKNVQPVAQLPSMFELNIGHSIIARAIFVGLTAAVREMKHLIS
jgi:pyridoxine 5-phosphate synthase